MADRCYLEKCRDRLYKEFVVGGIAVEHASPGEYMVRYESGVDLLRKTPGFYQAATKDRLQKKFNRAYRYVEVLFDGQNPYVDAIRANLTHLVRVLKTDNWELLRREPPYFVGTQDAVESMDNVANRMLAAVPREHGSLPTDLMPA
jgi:lysophospholipase L1-like esterase